MLFDLLTYGFTAFFVDHEPGMRERQAGLDHQVDESCLLKKMQEANACSSNCAFMPLFSFVRRELLSFVCMAT